MSYRLYLTCLWPGLSRAWLAGDLNGLFAAVTFCLLLNAATLGTLLWSRAWGGGSAGFFLATLAWGLVLCFWGGGLWHAACELRSLTQATARTADAALFCEAQLEYLKGDWIECERCLTRLLARTPRDAEARLLLASTRRQAGRLDEAAAELDALERFEGAARWLWEIHDERQRLARLRETESASGA